MHILYSVQTRTHPGKVRKNNEDAYGTVLDWREKLHLSDETLQQRGHLFAVADGMGGHAAGEVASNLAIKTLFTEYYTGKWVDPKTTLAAAIMAANRAIFEQAQADARLSGMGTTLVAALYRPEYGLVANVGDSRAYLFRFGKIVQVTHDHSWVAEQLDNGILTEEEASHHPFRNVITRALGNEAKVTPEFFELPPLPGDILLLCSDGLSNQVSDREMTEIMAAYSLDEAAEMLLNLALERGAPDNVTLALIQLQGGAVQRRSRSLLPWVALMLAMLIIVGFVVWNFLPSASRPKETVVPRMVELGTFTPSPSLHQQKTPSPTSQPVVTATRVVTPTLPAAMGAIVDGEAIVYATPAAIDPRPLVFVSGRTGVQPISEDDALTSVTVEVANERFSADLDKKHYVGPPPPVLGGRLSLVGYILPPVAGHEDFSLDPLLLLAPFGEDGMFSVEWQVGPKALKTLEDRFGVRVDLQAAPGMNIIQLTQ